MPSRTGAADGFGRALLAGYRLAGRVASPALPFLLRRRAARGKEIAGRIGERRGEASLPRPAGPLVWCHAASVGETITVLPLVAAICARGVPVLLTTVTVTAAGVAAARLPAGAMHQFAPVDVMPWIERFLGHWRPDLAIFAEQELWPATMAALAGRRTPLVLVNARLSPDSFRTWQRLRAVAAPLLADVTLCLAQTEADAARYRALGAPAVRRTGNLKFDLPPPAADPAELGRLRASLGDRPVWVAASTHPGEEEAVAAAHRMLAADRPDLLTVVVPRHPPRGAAVAALFRAAGIVPALRSAGEPPVPAAGAYVADTIGELGLFYRLAPLAFLGGSLIAHGGQNPIEPVRLGAAVLHGPHVANFAEVYAAIDAACPAAALPGAEALAAAVARLLADRGAARAENAAAAAALAPLSGGLSATLDALEAWLQPLAARAVAP
jgi:3-deoxy-D-manno-octulosonic-acid transferase